MALSIEIGLNWPGARFEKANRDVTAGRPERDRVVCKASISKNTDRVHRIAWKEEVTDFLEKGHFCRKFASVLGVPLSFFTESLGEGSMNHSPLVLFFLLFLF